MKKVFFTLVAIMVATVSFAQNTMVATLSHNDDITMYYGAYAYRDAMNAAQSGDVINLSGGAFQAVTITKGVTLRGTGIDVADPTYIINDFDINIPTEDTNRLMMEGIRCTGTIRPKGKFDNPHFIKCWFKEFSFLATGTTVRNITLVDCKVTEQFRIGTSSVWGSVQFINCYIVGYSNSFSNSSFAAMFMNCVIHPSSIGYISKSQILNSIIYGNSTYSLPNSTIASNCVSIGYNNAFNDAQSSTGCKTSTLEEMFKNFTGTYSDDQTFELTDAAKTQFLGTDGTQVGMYGGVMPYSSTPSYPQITKMNVANKTTADGKLSVDIEVSAAQ